MRLWTSIVAALALVAVPGLAQAQPSGLAASVVAEGFDQPVFVAAPPDDARLFVVEQTGRIKIVRDGAVLEQPFLDLSGAISTGGERGLLGLAFHPDFAGNGRFYVNYTDHAGRTQIARYTVSAEADRADPGSVMPILRIDQPAPNHNGGWIAFGPDGYLYVGMGDGGGGGDPWGNGQDPQALLGKMLRLDVDGGEPYAIPASNPFAAGGGAPEVFLLGLRNPWRSAFDGNDLYIADVGQNQWEEVSVLDLGTAAGANLGWNLVEGDACFAAPGCDQSGLVAPVHTYSHAEGCSITGGAVYRGAAIPSLAGYYVFGDYCSSRVWAFRYAQGQAEGLVELTEGLGNLGAITSFGLDHQGEIHVTVAQGRLLKLVAAN